MLPQDRDDLFACCLETDQKTLLDILAFCVDDQIDAQASELKAANLRHADAIADAIDPDIDGSTPPIPHPPHLQTGIPSFRALSARLS